MDKEDFEQWRESPVTQWFMKHLEERANAAARQLQEQVFGMAAYPPEQWAAGQPQAAYVKGHSEALMAVTAYSLDDLEPQEDNDGA